MNTSIKKKDTEIIPSSELPRFAEAVVYVEGLAVQLEEIRHRVANIKVRDREEFRTAGELVAELKKIDKQCEQSLQPYKDILKEVSDYIKKKGNAVYDEVEQLRKLMNTSMGDFTRKEEADRKAEEAREQAALQLKLQQEAEAKRIADQKAAAERRAIRVKEIRAQFGRGEITKRQSEKLLREAGATEEADKAAASAAADEAKVQAAEKAKELVVESNVPNVAGVQKRTNFHAACSDRKKFLQLMADDFKKTGQFGPLWAFVVVSDELLNAEAIRTKDHEIMRQLAPGAIRAWDDKTF